jgi:hypothetical protein
MILFLIVAGCAVFGLGILGYGLYTLYRNSIAPGGHAVAGGDTSSYGSSSGYEPTYVAATAASHSADDAGTPGAASSGGSGWGEMGGGGGSYDSSSSSWSDSGSSSSSDSGGSFSSSE